MPLGDRFALRAVIAALVWALLSLAGCSRQHFAFGGDDEPDGGADAGRPDASAPDAGRDAAAEHEAGAPDKDGGPKPDAGKLDGSVAPDASLAPDASHPDAAIDAGLMDASVPPDAGPPPDEDDASVGPELTEVQPNLRLAFFGDQGFGVNAEAVLQLIKNEGADLVIHAGDLDYLEQPLDWDGQVTSVLGPDFPYFVAIGNHDAPAWAGPDGYQELIQARLARVRAARCTGDLGVNSVCRFRGLSFVLSGVGTYGEGHEAYLDDALAKAPEAWKLCVWHKNQRDMQVGGKADEVGWLAYRLCEGHGALILTGHEHSYSRTYTLSGVGYPEISHGWRSAPDRVVLEPGSTAVVVSGLGGMSARAFYAELHPDISWWASIYARNYQVMNGVETGALPNIEFGALFIDFHVDGDPHKARAYFKTVSGAIIDSFEITVAP